MVGYSPVTESFPTSTSKEFVWKTGNNEDTVVEFNLIGNGNLSDSEIQKITEISMNAAKNECNSINFIPTILTINTTSGEILSAVEFNTATECSITKSLQTVIFFDDDGNVTETITTLN